MDIYVALILLCVIAVCCLAWASHLVNEVLALKHEIRKLRDELRIEKMEVELRDIWIKETRLKRERRELFVSPVKESEEIKESEERYRVIRA